MAKWPFNNIDTLYFPSWSVWPSDMDWPSDPLGQLCSVGPLGQVDIST